MSVLTATSEDFAGRALANGTYRVTVLEAKLEKRDNNDEQLYRMYGNIRKPTGEPLGNRKLFRRSWLTFGANEKAQEIGNQEIKREALAAGLIAKPAKGESVSIDVDEAYAAALVGRDVTVRVEQRPRWNKRQELERELGRKLSTAELRAAVERLQNDEIEAEVVAWVVEK